MEKRKTTVHWICIPIFFAFVIILGAEALGIYINSDGGDEKRPDIVTINTMKTFGPLERPEVFFFHDLHTDALEKNKKDCKSCHLSEKADKKRLSRKFKRLEDTAKQEVMDIYHAECIGCHKETAATGQKAGPVEVCGECHGEKPKAVSSRQPMGFDKSLHFRHEAANKDIKTDKGDCGRCHHSYDEKTKKLFYDKEKEGSCRYCHMEETEENRISMRLASHSGCIDCHMEKLSGKKDSGPFKCGGCHDLNEQRKIKKVEKVPRVERKQPDVVLLRAEKEKEKEGDTPIAGMNPVPFDHKAHEEHNDTCMVCHHAQIDSCSKTCHTTKGSKEGENINLERAMHQRGLKASCIGCHDLNQGTPKCAACHALRSKEKEQEPSCNICHMGPLPEQAGPAKPRDEKKLAEMLLKTRKAGTGTYADEDIPEKVIIKELEDKYGPVELPHRKIVRTLLTNIKDNKLADYFHNKKYTICGSCHHNSPPSKKPPRCGSCHGAPFNEKDMFRPGIKGAFHQQCIGCHKTLDLEKPKSVKCIDCHKEKNAEG